MARETEKQETEVDPEDETLLESEPSAIKAELKDLKEKISKITSQKEKIPQPLFWSLFNSKINQIKESKAKSRKARELLSALD